MEGSVSGAILPWDCDLYSRNQVPSEDHGSDDPSGRFFRLGSSCFHHERSENREYHESLAEMCRISASPSGKPSAKCMKRACYIVLIGWSIGVCT
jgi:hypothetical protein